MNRFYNLLKLEELKKNIKSWDFLALLGGSTLLAYVFYAGLYILPQVLTNLLVFASMFIGLSLLLRLQSRRFEILLFALYVGLFFLPITWLWRGLEFDDNVFMGIFPFNDAKDYLLDSYRLYLGVGNMIMYNGRPLLSGLLAFCMWLFGGNIQLGLALICVCTVISIFSLALEIRELAGPYSAGMASTILFYFSLPYLGRVHTENLGLMFGALGLALFLRGVRINSLVSLIAGAFSLSMALNGRAGAFFALPILVIWIWFYRKHFGEKAPILLMGAFIIGFLVNLIIVRSFALNVENIFSNFGHSLYGLAAGYKGWAYIYTVHPEFSNTFDVLPYALELIYKNPLLFIKGVLLSYRDYLSPGGMFYLFNFQDQQSWIDWILYLLTIVGLCRLYSLRQTMYGSLLISLVIGIFLSMSMIPHNDNGMRVLMATNPVNALVTGLAFLPVRNIQQRHIMSIRFFWLEGYAVALGIACLFGPFIVSHFASDVSSQPNLDCPAGTEQISIIIEPGSYLNVEKGDSSFDFFPNIKKTDIRIRLEDYYYRGNVPYDMLLNFPGLERLVRELDAGDTIMMGMNLLEFKKQDGPGKVIFLIVRTDKIEQFDGVNHFCASLYKDDRLSSNRFYHDESIKEFE